MNYSRILQDKGQDKSAAFPAGEGGPKSVRTLAVAVRAAWEAALNEQMPVHAGALLHPLRGPFLKIEELNLWYNFRSKNNRKHVFTGDCHAGWL